MRRVRVEGFFCSYRGEGLYGLGFHEGFFFKDILHFEGEEYKL
jgi:hypothetical protein